MRGHSDCNKGRSAPLTPTVANKGRLLQTVCNHSGALVGIMINCLVNPNGEAWRNEASATKD